MLAMHHIEIRSATVTVSGYPPIPAALVLSDGKSFATVSANLDLQACVPGLPPIIRCQGCLDRVRSDLRLGIRGYCTSCLAPKVATCLAQHKRLPTREEFWCGGCGDILPREEMQTAEPNGRLRQRCHECRGAQLKKAKERWQLRRYAG